MNVGIRNLMKGRVGERRYEGESLTGEGIHSFGGGFFGFWGRKHFGEGGEHWFHGLVFLVLWESFQTVSIIAGGTGLLGVLGTGAKIPFGFLELGSQTGCS